MTEEVVSMDKVKLYQECFHTMAEKDSIFHHILDVLAAVAGSDNGIGEVVQDYAKQAHMQLKNIMTAGCRVLDACHSEDDLHTLHGAGYVLGTVGRFLELLPAAMKRNKAAEIGKEKFSLRDIERITQGFHTSTEVKLLQVIHEGTTNNFAMRA